MSPEKEADRSADARWLLVLLALAWGLSWPIMRIGLDEMDVFTFRAVGFALATAALFGMIFLQGRSAFIARGIARWHLVAASVLNVIGFGLFSSLAQLTAATSRVVIVNYSMPVWSSLLAWLVLDERLNTRAIVGLALCVAGLATLLYPVAGTDSLVGLLLALGCAWCWGGGTIYMKWARIPGDLLTITAWQILIGTVFFSLGLLVFQGGPAPTALSWPGALAALYTGVIATGLGYLLWFAIIERLPTATASLGALATPVVGVLSSIAVLDERLSLTDGIGFALIFAAAACVLLQPRERTAVPTP